MDTVATVNLVASDLAKLAYIGLRPVSPVVPSLNDLIKHDFTPINKQILLNIQLNLQLTVAACTQKGKIQKN
jgi:hypothetical protein